VKVSSSPDAFLSVIVPVYNDASGLRTTVLSLLRQTYSQDCYEIIIVDNASSDETAAVAVELAAANGDRVKAVVESTRGSYAARNEGIRLASGEILCFVDANVSAEPVFLSEVAACFADDEVHYLGCRIALHTESQTVSAAYDLLRGSVQRDYLDRSHFAVTAGMCVRREVISSIGSFDARLESNGDKEFGHRLHAAGFRQQYASHIVLRHPARETFSALAAKAARLGRGIAQLEHFYPNRYRNAAANVGYFSLRKYLPPNPARIAEQLRENGFHPAPLRALALSGFGILLRFCSMLSYLKERRRLARSAQPLGAPAVSANV
jgi:glycosyltransferase AglI